ncbi:hypothetical protein DWX10_00995 [Clostridium sp. AF18-27]|nr:hypothetical protein DWX10_00995 [Clostridium sp. AF18-27]
MIICEKIPSYTARCCFHLRRQPCRRRRFRRPSGRKLSGPGGGAPSRHPRRGGPGNRGRAGKCGQNGRGNRGDLCGGDGDG